MRYFAHLQTAIQLIQQYNGSMPFAAFLKQYFAQHKKYGSKDRKSIAHLCYCYFRLGKSVSTTPTQENMILALWLCSSTPNPVLEQLNAELNAKAEWSLIDKLNDPAAKLISENHFPFQKYFSKTVDVQKLVSSYFTQPDVFLRLRNEGVEIQNILTKEGIPFQEIDHLMLSIPNNTKVDEILPLNEKVVIQDASSQKVGRFIKEYLPIQPRNVWDCCAASGGKSIMLVDMFPKFQLTVSDVRSSILFNLQKRFHQAKIKQYASFVADLTEPVAAEEEYDFIIADVPCSGSGTWARTPEQLVYFKEEEIQTYSSLQAEIVKNIIPALQKGGYLAYCTCSIFAKENEEQVQGMVEKFGLELIKHELIKGYDQKADSLFIALLKKV